MKNLLTIVVLFVVVFTLSGSAIAQKRGTTDRRVANFASIQNNIEATVPDKPAFQAALENFAKIENLATGKFRVMLIQYEDRIAIQNFMFHKESPDGYGPTWTAQPDGSNVEFLPVEKRGDGLMVAQFQIGTTVAKATATNNIFRIGNRNYVIY